MSIQEATALDMSTIMLHAYDVGDMINTSAELADYLYWKHAVDNNEEVQELIRLFAKKKERFEECERFGHFHPSYHEALQQVQDVQEQMDKHESVRRYKAAEDRLDDLLYTVSETIAHAVSDTIKVPTNKLLTAKGCSGGCSSCG